jgi:hypothetical protein
MSVPVITEKLAMPLFILARVTVVAFMSRFVQCAVRHRQAMTISRRQAAARHDVT